MRTILPINDSWHYKPSFTLEDTTTSVKTAEGFELVNLPHANVELPYNYFSDKQHRFISCYKRELSIRPEWAGEQLFLDFEGVMNYSRVFVNGLFAGEHKGGYTPFSVDITSLVSYNGDNEVTVMVDSTERPDTPPFGAQIDYLTYGGIYREVQLRVVSRCYLADLFVTTPNALQEQKEVNATVSILGKRLASEKYAVEIRLLDGNVQLAHATADEISEEGTVCLQVQNLADIELWTMESPKLYQVVCTLYQNGTAVDEVSTKIGFRTAEFTPEGFFLNSQKVKIRGLNRHQAYPYVGYAMPERAQKRDADVLKYDLGLNLVRTSHYPQSHHFLDRCDEIGLLVFEEIPGWQHIGDDEWKAQAVEDVRQMILRDRNHPSIILWGVRINESPDDHDFYLATNAMAKSLDTTRCAGGVRCIANSELLEDVYTMNDFVHDNGYSKYLASVIKDYQTYDNTQGIDGEKLALREQQDVTGLDHDVPYLVTEFCGHMYPTKRYDQEERMVEHALRHTRVQNAAASMDNVSGAIGWCAFDYNTHADFGSGDKICYHGVMDMYRIPKFAASVYSSQISPEEKVVMEPATYWSRGERSIGGVIPLVIYTNCDSIQLYCLGELLGTYYPDTETYPGLKHPPVMIDKMAGGWGNKWEDAIFVGYVNGKEVIRRRYLADVVPTSFTMKADDTTLCANAPTWDTTRVEVSILDQAGNGMPFLHDPAQIVVEGAGSLIGPNLVTLVGGKAAFWVKTNRQTGTIRISVTTPRLQTPATTEILVK